MFAILLLMAGPVLPWRRHRSRSCRECASTRAYGRPRVVGEREARIDDGAQLPIDEPRAELRQVRAIRLHDDEPLWLQREARQLARTPAAALWAPSRRTRRAAQARPRGAKRRLPNMSNTTSKRRRRALRPAACSRGLVGAERTAERHRRGARDGGDPRAEDARDLHRDGADAARGAVDKT